MTVQDNLLELFSQARNDLTAIPAIEQAMRSEVSARLLAMVTHREALHQATAGLEAVGVEFKLDRRVHLADATEKVLMSFFDALCQALTKRHASDTPAKVEIDDDLYTFQYASRYSENDTGDRMDGVVREKLHAIENAATGLQMLCLENSVMSVVDFNAIVLLITQQVKSLEATGLCMMADKLLNYLNAQHTSYYAPQVKGRHIAFTRHATTYPHTYRDREGIEIIDTVASHVGRQSGVVFGDAINNYLYALHQLGYSRSQIASRTVFGKGTPLEIHCFKEKVEYRFTHKGLEAVLAFVCLYGSDAHIESAHHLAGLMQANAA